MSLMTGWKKCPSVTPNGKQFFYYNKAKGLTVVWERIEQKWIIHTPQGFVNVILGHFETHTAAIKAANNMKGNKQ